MVLAVAALWLLARFWDQVLLIIVAVLADLELDLPVTRLEQWGWRRGRAVGLLVVIFIAVIALLITLVVPPVTQQGERLAQKLPGYVDELRGLLTDDPAVENRRLGKIGALPSLPVAAAIPAVVRAWRDTDLEPAGPLPASESGADGEGT